MGPFGVFYGPGDPQVVPRFDFDVPCGPGTGRPFQKPAAGDACRSADGTCDGSCESVGSDPPLPSFDVDPTPGPPVELCFHDVYEGDSDIVVRAEGSRLVIELSYEQKGRRHVLARAEMDATAVAVAMDNGALAFAVTRP